MTENTEHQTKNDVKDEATPENKVEADENLQDAGETPDEDRELEIAEAAAKSGFADPLAFLSAELDRLESEKAELNDSYLRAHAEMENLRRRARQDVADAREFSIAGFAREMLGVADNLRRALEAVPEEVRENGDKGFAALIEGVEMTERAMAQALEKHGVKRIRPVNERFDPNLHQAMFEIENSEVPNKTVLEVVQDGFVIGNRCLRPAMVGVSKGGPKSVANDNGASEEQGDGSEKAAGSEENS